MVLHSMKLHSTELHSINDCFSVRINMNNISIILYYVPMKINKNTANAYIYYGKYD